MAKKSSRQPLILFRFEGSAIRDGRILFDDLLTFISNYNLAIERVISVLVTGSSMLFRPLALLCYTRRYLRLSELLP